MTVNQVSLTITFINKTLVSFSKRWSGSLLKMFSEAEVFKSYELDKPVDATRKI